MKYKPIIWTLYFDGSKYLHGVGIGIVLVSPTNHVIPIAYKLDFKYTNNMGKYEALILGFKVPLELKIIEIEIYEDSQLIVNKFNIKY